MAHYRIERRLLKGGVARIAGVDEVGRGPLAGPVAAAAVVLDPRDLPRGVDDSKALDAVAREDCYERVMRTALAIGIGFASPREIDRINIRQATLLAMRRAIAALAASPDHVLVDGNDGPAWEHARVETLIKGDAISLSIAAASVIAKVTRDRLMVRLDRHHPAYGFARHKGYATAEHRAALGRHGPSPAHRMSFAPCRPGLPPDDVEVNEAS